MRFALIFAIFLISCQWNAEQAQNGDVKEFRITARQFSFTPGEIEVKKGDTVRLIITSADVPHGFAIPEYGINEVLMPGEIVSVEFIADKEGTFTAYCSIYCGTGHSEMESRFIVN